MELKSYQKDVQRDLKQYLSLLVELGDQGAAYNAHWEAKGYPVSLAGMRPYKNRLPRAANVCLKVPTGGGKTFLACSSLKPIFDALEPKPIKAVVWLVPSDAILEQTLRALRTPEHPYRQKLDTQFGGRVEVYTKEQLLNGQNFNFTAVTEQVTIMVLSYDSFRGRTEALKSKRENSNLAPMAAALGAPQYPVEGADDTALINIINQLNPVVIVDESHHARTTLSLKMLQDFNPCFVLDLTATPTEESNIISYVNAAQLKKENMVKLPVLVQNCDKVQEVVQRAMDIRNKLEAQAQIEDERGGAYIRPIVLFQAQPKNGEESETFEKLREKLISYGIPGEQIAVKTATINELKNIDLLSRACPIRYIITINALKEGWDCPFAYILASLANKTSNIDVEQILGRILRQPYARPCGAGFLNMSYVLTCSSQFSTTLDKILDGLKAAGFTRRDCRVSAASPEETDAEEQGILELTDAPVETPEPPNEGDNEGVEDILNSTPQEKTEDSDNTSSDDAEDEFLKQAAEQEGEYTAAIDQQAQDGDGTYTPNELQDMKPTFRMCEEHEAEARELRLPQFFHTVPQSIFSTSDSEHGMESVTKEFLLEDFSLRGQPSRVSLTHADNMRKIDVRENDGGQLRTQRLALQDQKLVNDMFGQFDDARILRECKRIVRVRLGLMNGIAKDEIQKYVDRLVDELTPGDRAVLMNSPLVSAGVVEDYVKKMQNEHARKNFYDLLDRGQILCRPSYKLPISISPTVHTGNYGGSLYEEEEQGNTLETRMMQELSEMDNLKWWHRNIKNKGFRINAYRDHWPDFIVCTKAGKIVMVETKGEQLGNTVSAEILNLGKAWCRTAGVQQYSYYMVYEFQAPTEEARTLPDFLNILRGM